MPPRLGWSEALGRLTRVEPLEEQGIPTWDVLRNAIGSGNKEEALAWLHYIRDGENSIMPEEVTWARGPQAQLTYIAQHFGEEQVERALRFWREKLKPAWEPTYEMTVEERLHYQAEWERANFSGGYRGFSVTEEAERYVLTMHPCGSCGKLEELEADGQSLGKTSLPYPWSWGRVGISYFVCHQCVWWEVMAIEDIGYPVKIHEHPETPGNPCHLYFYKEPAQIPERYFTRVGKVKEVARIRHRM